MVTRCWMTECLSPHWNTIKKSIQLVFSVHFVFWLCQASSDSDMIPLPGKTPHPHPHPISLIYTFQELRTATLFVARQSACCIFQTSQWALSFFRKPVNLWETRSFIWGWKTTTCFKQFSHDKSIVSVRVFRKVCEGVRGMHVCAHLSGSV